MVYFNKIARIWVIDPLDYFFLSAFIGSLLASRLKHYLSEKQALERLKHSIINKSRLIESEPSKATIFSSKQSKIKLKKVIKVALSSRGGEQIDLDYELAQKIHDLITKLAAYLKQKELRARLFKIIFSQARLILGLILHLCKINLHYVVIGDINPQVIVIACSTGGATGFVFSWITAGALISVPATILSFFFLRSFSQQILHNVEYTKLLNNIRKWSEDEDIREEIKKFFIETQTRIDNSNKIKLESLNWNKNPEIKQAAERLGIFENPPVNNEKLNLDLLDPDSNKILEEIGIVQNPDLIGEVKEKTVLDILEQINRDNKADLGVIDAEIIKRPARVKIRNPNLN